MNIKFLRDCLEETKSAYKSSKNNLLWLEQYNLENQNYRDYEGREILELLQNADDAQSTNVDLCLDTNNHILTIKNYGDSTQVFTDMGMRSIMASHLSPKKNDENNKGNFIGAKGLGFKSILNWTSEITIKSDNVIVRFGEDIVSSFWNELKSHVSNPRKFEEDARKEGHLVPLPILRIPEIREWEKAIPNTTVIELDYIPEKAGDRINRSLKDFTPESLLFLHHLRSIRIVIDGEEKEYALRKISENDEIEQWKINESLWLVSRKNGVIEDRNFEVAAAFNLDHNRKDSYNFFTYFPTDEEFPFPCILHATLELNASRKAILSGEKINSIMMPLLADRIISLADQVKELNHSWDAYNLVTGNFLNRNYKGYAMELRHDLQQKAASKEYIPIISDSKYTSTNDCYYYNDSIFNFVKDNGGSHIFDRMMLRGKPVSLNANPDTKAKEHIEEFVQFLTDYEKLAKFIKAIYEYYAFSGWKKQKVEIRLLKDDNEQIIDGTAYLNTGRKIANIPSFLKIKYVDEDLKKHLLKEFGLPGTEQDQVRAIATKLNDSISNISASDVSGIKRMLMLSRSDEGKYDREEINQIIECLFNLFITNSDEFKKSKLECYLPSEAGPLRLAKDLIFGDSRFPNGINNLNLSHAIYDVADYVAYPAFLMDKLKSNVRITENEIQNFYAELGVNKYFRNENACFGDDREYLQQNNIAEQAISNAGAKRVGNEVNIERIPVGIDNWKKLNLTDIIKLICISDLKSQVIENRVLTWYYSRGWFTENLTTNYLSYILQKKTAVGKLANFVISTKEWIANPENGFEYDDKDEIVALLLKRLGAKESYSDFTPNELYALINAKAEECKKTGNSKGVQDFYHRIKVAFVSMGKDVYLPDNVNLCMMCKQNGVSTFKDSREIFYSNNWNSEKLKETLPILSLQLRDGEEEVKRYFGCRRLKDLKVILSGTVENNLLCSQLNSCIQKCKPFILALISKDSGDGIYDKDKKWLVERITMNVVRSASYCFEYDGLRTEEEKLHNGEMMLVEKIPVLCSNLNTLTEALSDPQFCHSIAEAMCIHLNLSTRDNIDKFYRIIKSSDRELEYLASSFTSDLWQSCQEAFGISDKELDFWKEVFIANKKDSYFDPRKIKEGKHEYIAQHLGIPLDRANVTNFNLYHIQQLRVERDKNVADYKIWLHKKLKDDSQDQKKQYLGKIANFQSDEWIVLNREIMDRYLISPDYIKIMNRLIKDKFGFDTSKFIRGESTVPEKKEIYDYNGIELNIEDESLLYFEGCEDYFTNLRNKYKSVKSDDLSDILEENPTDVKTSESLINISLVDTEKRSGDIFKVESHNRRGRGHTRRRLSETDLKKIGNEAEDKVLRALRAMDSQYEVGSIFSEHLNPDTGNDAQGYDLEYKRKGESIFRCLEIKHFTGTSIIVSRHEYETARSDTYKNRYDVALVSGNEIQIWENAFSDESKYTISSDDYTISFQVNNRNK